MLTRFAHSRRSHNRIVPSAKIKNQPPQGPDDLVRESAGAYRSGDERFRVEKSDVGWYLIDSEQANEFGQQLIHGPLPTLDAVRKQMPGARELKLLLRVQPPKRRAPTSRDAAKAVRQAPAPLPPPASWIDRLPGKEATEGAGSSRPSSAKASPMPRRSSRAIATIPRRLSQLASSNSDCVRLLTSNRKRIASARRLSSAKWRGSWALAARPSNGRRRAGRLSRSVTGMSRQGRESGHSIDQDF